MLFRERQLMSLFKLNDWVISTKYPKASPVKIQHQHAIDTGVLGTYVNSKGQASLLYAEECKLWQPKVGEWVWSKGSYTQAFIFKWTSAHEQIGIINYTNYEPFIGQLPTFIKDQS